MDWWRGGRGGGEGGEGGGGVGGRGGGGRKGGGGRGGRGGEGEEGGEGVASLSMFRNNILVSKQPSCFETTSETEGLPDYHKNQAQD